MNVSLSDNPALVNENPMEAWFFKLKVEDLSQLDGFMSEEEYKDFIG